MFVFALDTGWCVFLFVLIEDIEDDIIEDITRTVV